MASGINGSGGSKNTPVAKMSLKEQSKRVLKAKEEADAKREAKKNTGFGKDNLSQAAGIQGGFGKDNLSQAAGLGKK